MTIKTAFKYTVSVDNINNDEWVDIYAGDSFEEADQTFKDYKFVEGDQGIHLNKFEYTWRYEGQVVPDADCGTTMKERYNFA